MEQALLDSLANDNRTWMATGGMLESIAFYTVRGNVSNATYADANFSLVSNGSVPAHTALPSGYVASFMERVNTVYAIASANTTSNATDATDVSSRLLALENVAVVEASFSEHCTYEFAREVVPVLENGSETATALRNSLLDVGLAAELNTTDSTEAVSVETHTAKSWVHVYDMPVTVNLTLYVDKVSNESAAVAMQDTLIGEMAVALQTAASRFEVTIADHWTAVEDAVLWVDLNLTSKATILSNGTDGLSEAFNSTWHDAIYEQHAEYGADVSIRQISTNASVYANFTLPGLVSAFSAD
eukprot:SAG22_NODE_5587_length_989_cov_0.859551_1_plen_300_part_10